MFVQPETLFYFNLFSYFRYFLSNVPIMVNFLNFQIYIINKKISYSFSTDVYQKALPYRSRALPYRSRALPYRSRALPYRSRALPYRSRALPYCRNILFFIPWVTTVSKRFLPTVTRSVAFSVA